MNVSVIVPTYNGAHKIKNVLGAIEIQTYKPYEVIVIIDGSSDETAAILSSSNFNFNRFKIIEQANGGRAKVRNRGAHEASGDLLVFFDDDMRPAPECIFHHVKHHRNQPVSILTGSQIEEIYHDASDIFRFKAFLSRKWSEAYNCKKGEPLTEQQIFLTAANFSISKQTFNLLQGFDERLTDAEDFDLAVRAFNRGIPLYVDLDAHAWHDDKVTCASYIRRLRQYYAAHQMLSELKPELYSKNKFLPAAPRGYKHHIFKLFAYDFWVKLVDQNRILKIIPRLWRYKLYDLIITANGVYFPKKASQ
jgi:glycosyltransferase involved in cell wall biosynthesis